MLLDQEIYGKLGFDGGSGGDDWSKYGFSDQPDLIEKIKNDMDTIINEFDPTKTSITYDSKDFYMFPSVDTKKCTTFKITSCSNLYEIAPLDLTNCSTYNFKSCSKLKSLKNVKVSNKITYMYQTFAYCSNLTELPTGFDTKNVTEMNSTFSSCSSLETIPNIDTSNVTDFSSCFSYCTKLKNVPIFNCTKARSFYYMFNGVNKLTNESIDNIMQSVIQVGSTYYQSKTLKELGFTSSYYSVSRIEALPHYQDFVNAGWSIGY